MASYNDEFINILEKILKDIDEINKSIDETFKENEDGCENLVEQTTQDNIKDEDTIDYYVISDESNGINQDIAQGKYITYPSNEENDNEIIDKEKDDLDQDCDKSQADVTNNNNDQCIDNNITITNARSTYVITRTSIKNIKESNCNIYQTQDKTDVFRSIISTKIPLKGTDTKYVGNNNTKIVKVIMYVEYVQLTTNIVKRSNHTSGKSVNKTLPSSYLMQIPRQNNQNEGMVVIKISSLKSSVRQRARIKDSMRKISFEDKAFPRGRKCYNNKIVNK